MNTPNPQTRSFEQTASTSTLLLAILFAIITPNCCIAANPVSNNTSNTKELYTSNKNYEQKNINTCTPKLSAKHHSIFCLDYANSNLIQPAFDKECSPLHSSFDFEYEDEYIDMSCSMKGFTGYFEPAQWTISKINGDGGVDVTGAPNITLVEGANKALVNVTTEGITTLKIIVPANGLVIFDWSNFGGSQFFYSLLVNGRAYQINTGAQQKGLFRSPVMRIGDVMEFQLKAAEINSSIEISNFNFFSNATGLVKRHWLASDKKGNNFETTQFIAIEKANITDVIFPANQDDIEAPIQNPTDYSPKNTGFPFIDRDGDLSTTDDQYQLEAGSCTFDIDWTDEWTVNEAFEFSLERNWIITDWCNGSTSEGTQIIKLNNFPALQNLPGFIQEKAKASDLNYEQITQSTTGLNKMVNPGGYGTAFRCKSKFSPSEAFPSLWDKLTVAATIIKNKE